MSIFANITCEEVEKGLRVLYDPTTDPVNDSLFFIRNITCSVSTCIPPNQCVDNSTCKCAVGTANFPSTYTGSYCLYKQKNQLTAFLLQFFIFNGAGQFYVGNINYAVPQLIICLLSCCLPCISFCLGMGLNFKSKDSTSEESRSTLGMILICLNCALGCCIFAWWLADAIIFGTNKYLDSNGVPLNSW